MWIQSCGRERGERCGPTGRKPPKKKKKEKKEEDTYQLVDIPAAVLAALLGVGHALVHAEVPVHVGRLLAAAVLGGLEAAAALGAGRAEVFVEAGEEVWAEAGGVSQPLLLLFTAAMDSRL